jgi:hypothetical protein
MRTQLQDPARAAAHSGKSLEGSYDAIACSALLQGQCRCICLFCGEQAARSGSLTADRSALSSRECYTPVLNRLGRAADAGRGARLMRARTSRDSIERSKKLIPGSYTLTQHLEALEVIKAVPLPPQRAGSTHSAASSANTSLTSLSKQLFWNITYIHADRHATRKERSAHSTLTPSPLLIDSVFDRPSSCHDIEKVSSFPRHFISAWRLPWWRTKLPFVCTLAASLLSTKTSSRSFLPNERRRDAAVGIASAYIYRLFFSSLHSFSIHFFLTYASVATFFVAFRRSVTTTTVIALHFQY